MKNTIALDAMGGDHGPKVVVPAALRILKKYPEIHIIFVGMQEVLEPLLIKQSAELRNRWSIEHTTQIVGMDELPSAALRYKKDSSMRVAINLVKNGDAGACVSAGNTGALMATARFVLKTLPGIDRPAIITSFPTREENKFVRVLDLGANVDSSVEHLYQFAVMGSTLVSAVDSIDRPRVGLLNIGEEQIKGNEQVKKASELLSQSSSINYIGYVEGDTLFSGMADVIVCDGFVGNITLKACEGVAKLIGFYAQQAFKQSWLTRLAAIPAIPILRRLLKQVDPRRRNGASLIGLNGTVIKSHGSAGEIAFSAAIEEAILELEKNVPELIRKKLASALEED